MRARMTIAAALLLLAGLAPASAQQIVADLSQSRVSIDTRFEGSEIVVFGAIKRTSVWDRHVSPFEVVVTVSGPLVPVAVRKKDRVAGIWVNTESVRIDAAPTLYKIAATAPLREVLSETEDLRPRVAIPRAIRSVGAPSEVGDAARFTDALIRIRTRDGHYAVAERGVRLAEQALFRANIALPANLVEGDYTTRIFLTRDREVVAEFTQVLDVRKVGLERVIYTLAHAHPLPYALLALVIAVGAGWSASAVFRYLRS
jgi:uncharacterized protein (TIGR02186 family)